MVEDLTLANDSSAWAAETWWARRRRRYNVGLVVAGLLGFVCYAATVQRCIDLQVPGEWEITIFTTFFQGLAYLVAMGIANVCYYLGPWSERIIHPSNIARYRKVAFRLGFWFSVLLPFTPSALLVFSCSVQAGEDKRVILGMTKPAIAAAAVLFERYK